MSSFSGTHLRVPRGWGALMEGLAREILRDQPEDIPKYAAQHLRALLKLREDCGMDYTKWDARQEARFYNSRAYKAAEPETEKEAVTEESTAKEKSCEPQTEDESNHDTSNPSTTQPNITEEVELTESTREEEEEDEDGDVREKHITAAEKGFSEEEAVSEPAAADTHSDELSRTKEDGDPEITTLDEVEKGSVSVSDQDTPQSEVEPSDVGMSNVDICAQELDTAEHEGANKQETAGADTEISESEEETQAEEPPEVLPYRGLADVDVCAAELEGREIVVETSPEDDTRAIDEDSSKSGPEESVAQSPLPQDETPESNEQQTEDHAEETEEKEGTEPETSSEGVHESLTHTEDGLGRNMTPNEDALVEISFEDVPEAQQIKEVEERQPEDEESAEALKMLESQQAEEFKEVIAEATEHHTESDTQENNETKMETVGEVFKSEAEEIESQERSDIADIVEETVEAANTDLNNTEDDEIKTFSSSHELTSEGDRENSGDVNYHKNEETEEVSEDKIPQNESNDQDVKEDETTATVGGAEEDVETEGQQIDEGGAEDHSSGLMEAESESLEASAAEENQESHRALVESQPDVEKEVTPEAERLSEEEKEAKSDSEVQETSEEGTGDPMPAADQQGEGGPPGSEDATEPEGPSRDKQEDCSRPQEEEDIMDIPLDDPEANRAAAKIQAGFRGHMTRKKMKPEDKAEGEEVSSTGDVLNGSQGDTETGGSGAVEGDDTSVPEQ